MSYDLITTVPAWPTDLDTRMLEVLRAIGVTVVNVDGPRFETGGLGWDPIVLQLDDAKFPFHAPSAWCVARSVTFNELVVDGHQATFHPPRDNTGPAWLCGAALAVACGGEIHDPQTGERFRGTNLPTMLFEINESRWPADRPLPFGWTDDRVIRFAATPEVFVDETVS